MLPTPLPAAASVARAVRGGSGDDFRVLGFHPVSRANPFQRLLYSRSGPAGFAPVGIVDQDELESLEVALKMGAGAVLHLHWTAGVLREATDPTDARRRCSAFLERIEALKQRGVGIVWTVHNVLPHRCDYPDVEAELRTGLASLADAIHVMAEDTLEATAPYYELPIDGIVEVPHPSYVGAYPGHIDRTMARMELGFDHADLVAGVIGSIQPYKGTGEFERALRVTVSGDPRLRGIVAGIPGRDPLSVALLDGLRRSPHIELIARQLGDLEIAVVVSSLDVMVLPYRASLNSGAAMLALTFGVPIVAPLTGHFRQLVERGFGIGYDPGSIEGLPSALGELRTTIRGFDRAAAARFAAEREASVISEQFFSKLRAVLGR